MDRNGDVSVAVARRIGDVLRVEDTNRIYYIYDTMKRDQTETGLRFEVSEDTYIEFSPLTLEVAHEIYPNTIRVFNDLAVLERYARRSIAMSDSYTENVAPEEVISFTVDEQDNVLALIKVTDTGDLFNWEGEDWIEVDVDDDNPNIFDQTVIDVEREDIGAALELWKESVANGSPLTKEDILTLAALEQ
jgi:hypothetical protein